MESLWERRSYCVVFDRLPNLSEGKAAKRLANWNAALLQISSPPPDSYRTCPTAHSTDVLPRQSVYPSLENRCHQSPKPEPVIPGSLSEVHCCEPYSATAGLSTVLSLPDDASTD